MKKKLLVGLGSFFTLVLIAIIAVVIYFFPYIKSVDWSIVTLSNVKALYVGLTEDPEKTEEKMKEIDNKRSEDIKNYINMEIREYTSEEQEKLDKGEITQTQLVAQIIAEKVQENIDTEQGGESDVTTPGNTVQEGDKPVTDKPDETGKKPSEETVVKKPSAEEIVARHIAALYSIQNNFEGRVAALAGNAKAYSHAYKKANPGITWRDAKIATMQHYMSTATGIENECYAQVDAQIEKLKKELKEIGADLSIVQTVKESAYAEMDAKKAKIVQEGTAKMNK